MHSCRQCYFKEQDLGRMCLQPTPYHYHIAIRERLIGMVGKRGRFALSIGCKGPRKASLFRPQATE
jgi:hypothetical protein